MILGMKTERFQYELIHKDARSNARLGRLNVFGKIVETPVFMPVGTQATVKFLSSQDIRDIKASFVLTEFDGKIYLSARSIDEGNVQVMMEKLGGGGHRSVAGAQFTGITMEEAVKRLEDVILEETGGKKEEP